VLFSARSGLQVSDLDETELDEYLDFCQKGLLRPGMSRALEDFFPLGPIPVEAVETAGVDREKRDQQTMAGDTAESGRHEPGEAYAIYRCRDSLGSVPDDCQTVIAHGARWTGVDEEMLLRVCERYERRLWSCSASGTRLPLRA